MSKKDKVQATYMQGTGVLRISVNDVMRFLKMIDEHQHTEKFAAAAKQANAHVKVDSDTVNFIKDYVVKNDLYEDPIGKHIVNARGVARARDRFDCNFAQHADLEERNAPHTRGA
jgi:hypothetical protein